MAASTKPKSEESPVESEEYDFEGWTEDDEKAAIAALAPEVRYIIVEKTFVGRFADGAIVKMPLSISLDDIDQLQAESESPVDQFKALLTKIGGESAARAFSSHDLAETVVMSERFFKIFSRIAQASLPE